MAISYSVALREVEFRNRLTTLDPMPLLTKIARTVEAANLLLSDDYRGAAIFRPALFHEMQARLAALDVLLEEARHAGDVDAYQFATNCGLLQYACERLNNYHTSQDHGNYFTGEFEHVCEITLEGEFCDNHGTYHGNVPSWIHTYAVNEISILFYVYPQPVQPDDDGGELPCGCIDVCRRGCDRDEDWDW